MLCRALRSLVNWKGRSLVIKFRTTPGKENTRKHSLFYFGLFVWSLVSMLHNAWYVAWILNLLRVETGFFLNMRVLVGRRCGVETVGVCG
jgi:hypothetical protein